MPFESRLWGVLWACLCALVLLGCSAERRLRAVGPTPYVRCLAGPEPADRTLSVGAAKVVVHGRRVDVSGLPAHPKLAAFSGPGFGPPPSAAALAELSHAGADALLMLGGLGDAEAEAVATAAALAKLDRPIFFLAGGRDRWSVMKAGLSSADRIIDVTSAHELRIGSHTLVLVPGADAGRYAVDDSACGFGASDLHELASALGPGPGRDSPRAPRWLASWHAPAAAAGQVGVTRTPGGVDIGSWTLSRFATQLGVTDGLYAWPSTESKAAPGLPGERRQQLVPRLWGPRSERSDGSFAPLGFALFTLGDTALERVR